MHVLCCKLSPCVATGSSPCALRWTRPQPRPTRGISCGMQVREGDAPAYYNAMEAAAVADLASGVLQQGGSRVAANDLGVIATYRKQARTHRRAAPAYVLCAHGSAWLRNPHASPALPSKGVPAKRCSQTSRRCLDAAW